MLHFRRRYEEGTYLHVDLKVGEEDMCHAVLDMTYPYGLAKTMEKPAAYNGIWRETRCDKKSRCRSWMGFGYTADGNTDYVDCAEHIFPCSVGYDYHSAQCAKKVSGEWGWCSGGSTCGKKAWMFELTVFETNDGQLGQAKLTVELTYILFNKDEEGRQNVEIMVAVNGVPKGSVKSKDSRDASLGDYNKDLLKRSAELFASSKRERVRTPHPPHSALYLKQVYQGSEALTGAPRVQGAEEEEEAMMRCILQLLNSCEAFNLSLLTQVLHDQLDAEATRWSFIDEMHAVLNRGETRPMGSIIRHLSPLPTERVPYDAHNDYPDILLLLLRLLISLKNAVGWGKWEVEIRMLVRRIFEMRANWIPVEGCKVCGKQPDGLPMTWHFPDMVLQCQDGDGDQLLDVQAAVKRRIEDHHRKIHTRCR